MLPHVVMVENPNGLGVFVLVFHQKVLEIVHGDYLLSFFLHKGEELGLLEVQVGQNLLGEPGVLQDVGDEGSGVVSDDVFAVELSFVGVQLLHLVGLVVIVPLGDFGEGVFLS